MSQQKWTDAAAARYCGYPGHDGGVMCPPDCTHGTPAREPGVVDPLVADLIAEAFHNAYERLAPQFNYDTRPESAVPWADVPEQNKALMRATVTAAMPDVQRQFATVKAERDALADQLRTLVDVAHGPCDGNSCEACDAIAAAEALLRALT